MKLIESKTLATAAASIAFTSIPQDGTDLLLVLSIRSDRAGNDSDVPGIRFNGSSANLTGRSLSGDGANSSSRTDTNGRIGVINGAASTSNTFSNVEVYIPNYTAAVNKSWSSNAVSESSGVGAYQEIVAGLWSNTAAITSVTITVLFGTNWVAGTVASLYKITKGSSGEVVVS
jgi:hypothetical protein